MVLRETDLCLNKASLGKYLKSSKAYPELSEKESWMPMSKFPRSSVSPEHHLQIPLFQCTNSEQWNFKSRITSAPGVCISEAALIYLKLSFQSEEKQLAQGVSPTESGTYISLSIKLWQTKYWGTRRQTGKHCICFWDRNTAKKTSTSLKLKNPNLAINVQQQKMPRKNYQYVRW